MLAGICHASTVSIPDSRRVIWQDNVGVPGGIPITWENCTTDACVNVYAGNVTHITINSAIASASDNTVIRIPSGTYSLTGSVSILRSKVILRGAGIGITTLNSSAAQAIITSTGGGPDRNGTIESGYAQGSNSVTLNSVVNMSVGDILSFSQDNESWMWARGAAGILNQPVVITGIDGNVVTFDPPLVWAFSADKNPVWYAYYGSYAGAGATPVSSFGVESMTIDQANSEPDGASAIALDYTYGCWVKDVEIKNIGDIGIVSIRSVRNEITGCYIHDTYTGYEGYGIELYARTSGWLVTNNIFTDLFSGIIINDSYGTVIAYNYTSDIRSGDYGPAAFDSFDMNHGRWGMQTLWEGNSGASIIQDGYHGGASQHTVFRNKLDGLNETYPTQHRSLINLCRYSRYFNVVGNILGDASWTPTLYELTSGTGTNNVYRLGYPHMGNDGYIEGQPPEGLTDPDTEGGLDNQTQATLARHLNYDYKTGAIRTCDNETEGCNGITGDTLPDSLYLTSKPSWFGSCIWPPIDPVLPTANMIPAKARYLGLSCTALKGSFSGSGAMNMR
jgi:hypothetical protein